MKALASFVRQKAKVRWVKFVEETSSLFFRRVKERKDRKNILSLTLPGGFLVEDRNLIKNHILDFYEDPLSNKDVDGADFFLPREGVMHSDEHPYLFEIPSPEDIRSMIQST